MVTVDYPSGRPAANTPCSLVQRMAAWWREWPYDGWIWDHMAIASCNPAGHRRRRSWTARRLSSSVPF